MTWAGLEPFISTSTVHWHLTPQSWHFLQDGEECEGATADTENGFKNMREVYLAAEPDYSARFTVPVLWDKKLKTIVNNESSEILRMLSTCFDELIDDQEKKDFTLYPTALQKDIDDANAWIYDAINNGVYKSGFATTQTAYDTNVVQLFKAMNRVEDMLSESTNKGHFLLGNQLTETDVRLYVTMVRFDCAYVQHFKCDLGTIRHNYPNINRWMKNLYWNFDAFKSTTDFNHIRFHYTQSHPQINPLGITPMGPRHFIETLAEGEMEASLKAGHVQV